MFSSHILNLSLCDIFKHNILLHRNKLTTFQFSIVHNVVWPLKYRVLSGVVWLWWWRSQLRYKSPIFRSSSAIHYCNQPVLEIALDLNVDPQITVGTAWRVPRVDNTDHRQIAAAGQHWTGKPLKHRLRPLLSDLRCTTIKCYSIYITNTRSPPPWRDKSV